MTSIITRPTRAAGPGRQQDRAPNGSPGLAADDEAGADLRGARTSSRTLRPTGRGLRILAILFLLAAVAVAATLGRAAWSADAAATSRAEALAAGKQLAINFITMNAKTFDADTARVVAGATGDFKKEYTDTLAKLKPVVTANQTVSTVERAEAAVVSSDADSAKVIVGVVAPTTNTATKTPEKKTYRMRLDLQKVGAAWKVASLEFVS